MSLFRRDRSPSSVLHCTAFAARYGDRRNQDVLAYMERPAVSTSVGQAFVLHVIGFVVTPRTFGARVILTNRQLCLWGQEDTCDTSRPHSERGMSHDDVQKLSSQLSDIAISRRPVNTDREIEETLQHRDRFRPTFGEGSRAHITLGCTQGSRAVETGLDLLKIIECEGGQANDRKIWQLDKGAARYYGDGCCAVYLNRPIKVGCLFSEQY